MDTFYRSGKRLKDRRKGRDPRVAYQLRKLEQGVTFSRRAEGSSVHGRMVPITKGVFERLCEIREEAIISSKVAGVCYGLNRVNEQVAPDRLMDRKESVATLSSFFLQIQRLCIAAVSRFPCSHQSLRFLQTSSEGT